MHHEDIKASIRKAGSSSAAIARMHPATPATVCNVIRGVTKSTPIAKRIVAITGLSFKQLWPGKYPLMEYAALQPKTNASRATSQITAMRKTSVRKGVSV
jgi:lambda repressor-like predicted transcriptional regulator